MGTVRVLVLRSPGANCDLESQYAWELAGAHADRVHINRLKEKPSLLQQYQILMIPGGFSYGDDVAAGKILALELQAVLNDALVDFRDAGKLILGVCNGFQALIKAGLLVPPDAEGIPATLAANASGRFEDRWVCLKAHASRCPFLAGYELLQLPIAHGEGRFICRSSQVLEELHRQGQIVLTYVDSEGRPGPYPVNPNGSQLDAAGICDATGRVLGLMPHPERHVLGLQHPQWTRRGYARPGDGLRLFQNAVRYFS
ncbi:MAG: phosphoribosylformylglycinamidine synthase I [Gemmataceae bacterium]